MSRVSGPVIAERCTSLPRVVACIIYRIAPRVRAHIGKNLIDPPPPPPPLRAASEGGRGEEEEEEKWKYAEVGNKKLIETS